MREEVRSSSGAAAEPPPTPVARYDRGGGAHFWR